MSDFRRIMSSKGEPEEMNDLKRKIPNNESFHYLGIENSES